MTYQSFPIVDIKTGLFTAKEAWLSPNDAFQRLNNVRLNRGKLIKRLGTSVMSEFPTPIIDGSDLQVTLAWADSTDAVEVTTSAVHGMSTGDYVIFYSVTGNGSTNLNNKRFFITVTSTTVFTLDQQTWSGLHASPAPSVGSVYNLKSLTKAGTISAIDLDTDNRPVVTTAANHGLSTGNKVRLVSTGESTIGGMTEIDGAICEIEVKDTDSFKMIKVDATDYTAYTSGGSVGQVNTSNSNGIIGIGEFEKDEASNEIIVCSQRRVAKWNTTNEAFDPVPITGSAYPENFSANSGQYIQYLNWKNKLYLVSRDIQASSKDGIWRYDGTILAPFNPTLNGSDTLTGAKFVFQYNRHLIALFTYEGSTAYPQRLRWSKIDDPDSWDERNPAEGASLDASTEEEIISANFVRDLIVVFFENSIWAIKKTGNADIPFRWEKIADDISFFKANFGSTSHQQLVMGFGRGGIFTSDGIQALPFDNNIPDFEEEVRDDLLDKMYISKVISQKEIWMSYASQDSEENNRVKVFNYEDLVWYEYDLEYSVMGTVSNATSGKTWQDLIDEGWTTWEGLVGYLWKQFVRVSGYPENLIGDRGGYIYKIYNGASDVGCAISCEILSSRLSPLKTEGKSTQLGYMDVLFDENASGSYEFKFFTDWQTNENITRTVVPLNESNSSVDKVWERVYVNQIGNIHRFQITHEKQSESFAIHAFVPHFRPSGRFNL